MAIRGCKLVGIEGPQGSGKTTLAHALTADFKRQHVHAACTPEATRLSPFFEDAIFRGMPVDMFTEFHIFGSIIVREHEMARNHELLFCDRTLVNVLAYSRTLLDETLDGFTRQALDALREFCRVYVQLYDVTFYVSDRYDLSLTKDPFRPPDVHLGRPANAYRESATDALLEACDDVGLNLLALPTGLDLDQKITWISDRL